MQKLPESIRRWWTFGHTYGWKRNLYRTVSFLLRSISGGACQLAIADILTAPVPQLRRLERLPRSLSVRLTMESDLPQLDRFVAPGQATARLTDGDHCLTAVCQTQILATEWLKIGPSTYHEDAEALGVVFQVPRHACWLYDGVSGEDGQALGPWGAIMGRLRGYLEEWDIETVYFQIGYENVYSLACHQSLGFCVVGRLCSLRFGRHRVVLYQTANQPWGRVRGGVFDLLRVRTEAPYDLTPVFVDRGHS
jgi:hypothetical protein